MIMIGIFVSWSSWHG